MYKNQQRSTVGYIDYQVFGGGIIVGADVRKVHQRFFGFTLARCLI
jgi:hypothetical protein